MLLKRADYRKTNVLPRIMCFSLKGTEMPSRLFRQLMSAVHRMIINYHASEIIRRITLH